MKITKLFLALICATLISCSNESDSVKMTTDAEDTTSSIMSRKGLTTQEVDELTVYVGKLKDSPEWIAFTLSSEQWVAKLNNVRVTFRDEHEVEDWLTANLRLTQFRSVNEGMQMFRSGLQTTRIMLAQNDAFFTRLSSATTEQATVILHPIAATPPDNQRPNSCTEGCMDSCEGCLDDAEGHRMTVFICYTLLLQDMDMAAYGAENSYNIDVQECVDDFNGCYFGC
jgi:hypothetical protein